MEIVLTIILAICILGLLGLGIYATMIGVQERGCFSIVLGLFFTLIVVLPLSYLGYDTYEKSNCVIKSEIVNPCVINKEHINSYTIIISTGKSCVPITYSEKYNITFKYKDVITTINNEQLYNQINIGEVEPMELKIYTQHNGKIYNEELEIPK